MRLDSVNVAADDKIINFDDELFFDDELEGAEYEGRAAGSWKILIVDDEPEVHQVTKLALKNFSFNGKPLTFLSAFSTEETKAVVTARPDIAVILLDVVMEKKSSGLEIAAFIREALGNHFVRIILRTGQPGEAPEESVILDYAINDYKTKAELTRQKLFATVVTGLRSYCDLMTIETNRSKLEVLYADLRTSHQELIKAHEAVERADRAKGDFLRIMNHELRTPLNAVIGMSDILEAEIRGRLNDKQLSAVATIKQSGKHLLALIEDILGFSEMQAETLRLVAGPVVVADVCQQSVQMINQIAGKKQINVSFRLDNTELVVLADQLRLKQILVNLLDNAVKFTPKNGQVGLDVCRDEVQKKVSFTVWDTGIGMESHLIDQIFRPFVQADSTITRPYEGAGLGLSLVHRLVHMHAGEISVESAPNQGTSVTCMLPMVGGS